MGYETQLYVGIDTEQKYLSDGNYFMVYGNVDMCKMGNSELYNLPWKNETPDVAKWYMLPSDGDGDTPVTVDRYGDMFKPFPIEDAITALEMDVAANDYRRFKWALAFLKSMKENSNEPLSVILWGY